MMPKTSALCAILIFTSTTLNLAFADELKKDDSSHESDMKNSREVDWRSRPIYLIKVKPGEATKEKVNENNLLPKRCYIRSEPRLSSVDDKTGKVIFGGWGVDITDSEKRFNSEPRILLKVGSIVPGSFLGDSDDRNYIFTKSEGSFAQAFKPTRLPVKINALALYQNGTMMEVVTGVDVHIIK